MEYLSVTIQIRAVDQHFLVALFIFPCVARANLLGEGKGVNNTLYQIHIIYLRSYSTTGSRGAICSSSTLDNTKYFNHSHSTINIPDLWHFIIHYTLKETFP